MSCWIPKPIWGMVLLDLMREVQNMRDLSALTTNKSTGSQTTWHLSTVRSHLGLLSSVTEVGIFPLRAPSAPTVKPHLRQSCISMMSIFTSTAMPIFTREPLLSITMSLIRMVSITRLQLCTLLMELRVITMDSILLPRFSLTVFTIRHRIMLGLLFRSSTALI